MRKLVFYSDQGNTNNMKINFKLLSLVKNKNAKVGYIPSCGDKKRIYYKKFCEHYKRLGLKNHRFFDLDYEYEELRIDELLSCEIIHLSAGDPIYFNQNMKRRNFLDVLRGFVDQGGILVGVSGGGLQMSRTVAIYKAFIGNLEDITDEVYEGLSALDLVDFEYLPHFNRWDQDFLDTVKAYSEEFSCLIYACRDGDGILVNDKKLEFIGEVIKIENGIVMSLEDSH